MNVWNLILLLSVLTVLLEGIDEYLLSLFNLLFEISFSFSPQLRLAPRRCVLKQQQ